MVSQLISLQKAQEIVEAVLAAGRSASLQPLSVAVLDSGGHLLAFAHEDKSSNMRPQIAMAKASGALALGVSSRKIAEMAVDRAPFINSVATLLPAGVIPAAGGVLILNEEKQVIGAVGVTGDTSDNDEQCALAGIAASGFSA